MPPRGEQFVGRLPFDQIAGLLTQIAVEKQWSVPAGELLQAARGLSTQSGIQSGFWSLLLKEAKE